MKKARNTILSPYAEQLTQWLRSKEQGGEGLTLQQTADRLWETYKVKVDKSTISTWWSKRQTRNAIAAAEDRLFDSIRSGTRIVEQVRNEAEAAPPTLGPLLKLLEALIIQLSVKGNLPSTAALLPQLIRTAIDGQRVLISAEAQKLDREKFVAAQKSKIEAGFEELAAEAKGDAVALELLQKFRERVSAAISTED
jgi:hypothetical protein